MMGVRQADLAAGPPPVTRCFVDVDGRQVHCRIMGSGPPAVFVHSSPANSAFVVPEMEAVADRYTCFAFDTPGFGLSDALPGERLQIADLADALAATLEAVTMPPCPVFGTHTGAAIALELGLRHPERVTGLMIDGLSCFTSEESGKLVAAYFKPFIPDPLGGHFSATWTRFRDQSIWFPWFARAPDALNASDLGSPASIDRWVTMYFDAVENYVPAYRAALEYSEGPARVAELAVPAVFTAIESDMLYPHLDRLPSGRHQLRRVGNDIAARRALTREAFDRFGSTGTAPAINAGPRVSQHIARQFIDAIHGQMFVRTLGDPADQAVLLLHDLPGTSEELEPRMTALAAGRRFVVAFDLPGCGHSDALVAPDLAAYAAALTEGCAALGIDNPVVWGIGWSSAIALHVKARRFIVEGLPLPNPVERIDLLVHQGVASTPETDGAHWFRTWQMLRDMEVWWPWYRPVQIGQRNSAGNFEARSLHRRTCEVRRQPGHIAAFAAILADDAAASLAACAVPVVAVSDSSVPVATAYRDALEALLDPAAFSTLAELERSL